MSSARLILSLESTDNQMNWLGEQLLGYGRIFAPGLKSSGACGEVTAGEIRAGARDFFRPDRLNLALVSPLKSARQVEKKLAAAL